eukprot:3934753-Pyramimonas_sp.AAC.1
MVTRVGLGPRRPNGYMRATFALRFNVAMYLLGALKDAPDLGVGGPVANHEAEGSLPMGAGRARRALRALVLRDAAVRVDVAVVLERPRQVVRAGEHREVSQFRYDSQSDSRTVGQSDSQS